MRKTPDILSSRPVDESAVDVIAEILDAVHLRTAIFGRLDLGAPWRLRVPQHKYLSFYVLARGGAWLELPSARTRGESADTNIALSAGDAVLLPRVSAHTLRDADRGDAPPVDFDYAGCPRVAAGATTRLGGDGPITTLIAGHFSLGATPRNALLASLPPAIHVPAGGTPASPQLAGVVPLIVSESLTPGPGRTLVLARLADLLLVHALRLWVATAGQRACGLRAIADPAIGPALRLMHARPAEPWTVERLAGEVNMSRSGFAARFAELVGEPPLHYLAKWRMTKAAKMLREADASVAAIADQVGYANAAAFTKAFARVQGVSPGAYRRAGVVRADQTTP